MCKNRVPEMTREDALIRMADLCARSEQCAFDIERKLRLKNISESDIDLIIEELERRKFLDSTRFARSYANDKLRFSGWGRLKIRAGLMQRHIPSPAISAALEALDEDEYEAALLRVATSKARSLDLSSFADRTKLLRHLVNRGFTPPECSDVLKRLRENEDS
ncbi:MAG: recombination regulator RecX [Muribaculaceae bacterium]|nr:recombination regulator RecX [Muribaculaceae bacterium]